MVFVEEAPSAAELAARRELASLVEAFLLDPRVPDGTTSDDAAQVSYSLSLFLSLSFSLFLSVPVALFRNFLLVLCSLLACHFSAIV